MLKRLAPYLPRDSGARPDISAPRSIHLVGIGGSGMRALAHLLLQMGHHVSGCDIKASPHTEHLARLGAQVFVGHSPAHVEEVGAEVVCYSTAVRADLDEIALARSQNATVAHRSALLAAASDLKQTLAVAGTHGKTTVTAMLALVMDLFEEGDSSFLMGGELNDTGVAAQWRPGRYFVMEADESDGSFLVARPRVAVIGPVDPDHLSHWGTFENLAEGFREFARRASLVVASAQAVERAGLQELSPVSVGHSRASFCIEPAEGGGVPGRGSTFFLRKGRRSHGPFYVSLPGRIYLEDAALAAAASLAVGVPEDVVVQGLARFSGVARRCELRCVANGVTVVDDYAHLPAEIEGTLEALRPLARNRLVAVFQPHRFSRVASLHASYKDCFRLADLVYVTDIYPAGEDPVPGVDATLITEAVAASGKEQVRYVPSIELLVSELAEAAADGDLIVLLNAGDLSSAAEALCSALSGGTSPGGPPLRGSDGPTYGG
jgi:UDP-N-acetylmuramate--alanine ligase